MKQPPLHPPTRYFFLVVLLGITLVSCSRKMHDASSALPGHGRIVKETGVASYYGDEFDGRPTANGETFRQNRLTAAHRTLPFGTTILVKNLSNGKTVQLRVNDRGPFVKGRIVDVSREAARRLDMLVQGIVNVELYYRKD